MRLCSGDGEEGRSKYAENTLDRMGVEAQP